MRTLVERQREADTLLAYAAEAVERRGRFIGLGAEAGGGKTALVTHVAGAVASQLDVRWGIADSVIAAAPLGAVLDAFPEIEQELQGASGAQRLRVYRTIRSALARQPTLLILEDVHWADDATLEFLRFIARRLHDLPLLLVATYRSEEVAHQPAAVLLGEISGLPDAERMILPPLSVDGVAELVRRADRSADAAQVHARTQGNPFYVTELLAGGDESLPETVRDAVLARAATLSPAARRVLAAAAVLGQRSDASLIAAVADEELASVDECARAGMLVTAEDGLEFRHDLARVSIEQALLPGERSRLHRSALSAHTARDPLNHRTLAHHAAGCGDDVALADHAPKAAARAADLGAHRIAAGYYRLALRVRGMPAEERARLFAALSYEHYLFDEIDEALAARREARDLFASAGDRTAVGDSERWLSRLTWFLGRPDDGQRHALRAVSTLEPLGDGHELAMAYSNLSQLSMLRQDEDEAVAWGERALQMARRIGDNEVEIHALNNVGTAIAFVDDAIEGRQLLEQSLDRALAADAHEHVGRAYTNLGANAVGNRRYLDADRQLRLGIAYCEDRDLDSWTNYMYAQLTESLAEQGRYDEVLDLADTLLRRPRLTPITKILPLVEVALIRARRGGDGSGLLAEATVVATETREIQRLLPVAAARAEVAWLEGRLDEIPAEVDRAWSAMIEHPWPWGLGELRWWLWVAGADRPTGGPVAEPFALMLRDEWRLAAAAWEQLGCPLWTAQCLGRCPDLEAAREAVSILDGLGAVAVRDALNRTRHAQGLPVVRGPRSTGPAHPASLTTRELEVLDLVAGGLTNGEIASRLYLSEKTVGHHVSSILHKLGEPTRARAVAAAQRRGIVGPR